jgi:hypothetical protein
MNRNSTRNTTPQRDWLEGILHTGRAQSGQLDLFLATQVATAKLLDSTGCTMEKKSYSELLGCLLGRSHFRGSVGKCELH